MLEKKNNYKKMLVLFTDLSLTSSGGPVTTSASSPRRLSAVTSAENPSPATCPSLVVLDHTILTQPEH